MTRETLVAIHAGSGIAGLFVGLAVFTPPQTEDGPGAGGELPMGLCWRSWRCR